MSAVSRQVAPTTVTIGNFDGVHLGHAALVQAARASLPQTGRIVALCFDPNPASVLRPESAPLRLSSFDQRREWLLRLGADQVDRLNPTQDFLAQSPEQFIAWLVDHYAPEAIIEGPDFRFGRRRTGTVETLRELGTVHGFHTIVVDPVEIALTDKSLVRASSSIARWLIAHGRVRDAGLVCDRPFEIRAQVVEGDRRGRELGVPTANLDVPDDLLLPADGIYAGIAEIPDGARYPAAISVGSKPTFGEHPRVCEAHLIDYDGPLNEYGWMIRLEFHSWMRAQLTYPNAPSLIDQLLRDVARARQFIMLTSSRQVNADEPGVRS